MITVKELENICGRIANEYGYDTPIYIEVYNADGSPMVEDLCRSLVINKYGYLYLSNDCLRRREE